MIKMIRLNCVAPGSCRSGVALGRRSAARSANGLAALLLGTYRAFEPHTCMLLLEAAPGSQAR